MDSALLLIRGVPERIDSLCLNTALSIASDIYLKAGIQDTAYMYAHRLAFGKDDLNRKIGFANMLMPSLRKFIPQDSLELFIKYYNNAVEYHLNQYEADGIAAQHAADIYEAHLQNKENTGNFRSKLINLETGFILIVIFSAFVVWLLTRKGSLEIIFDKIFSSKGKSRLSELPGNPINEEDIDNNYDEHRELDNCIKLPNINECVRAWQDGEGELLLKERKRQEAYEAFRGAIIKRLNDENFNYVLPEEITNSEVYGRLQRIIEKQGIIRDDDEIWAEILAVVLQVSPKFVERLKLLMGSYDQRDFHLALLIKCGIRSRDMEYLYSKAKGTVSYYRSLLCSKLMGRKRMTVYLDRIISLL